MSERSKELYQRIVDGGVARIKEMIDNQEVEELFLDYKRSTDNGDGNKLHDRDRNTLSKAISGFANSEGGVIVWGVECRNDPDRGDVPTNAMYVKKPNRFRSWIEGAIGGTTVPAHPGVLNFALTVSGADEGYVATLVPQGAYPPYQIASDKRYYMRAGSSFEPVPHAVLSGLFGRRPSPAMQASWHHSAPRVVSGGELKFAVELRLRNAGLGIAEDIYANAEVISVAGTSRLRRADESAWNEYRVSEYHMAVVSTRETRLPRGVSVGALVLEVTVSPSPSDPLRVRLEYGASGTTPNSLTCEIGLDAVREISDLIRKGIRSRDQAVKMLADKFITSAT